MFLLQVEEEPEEEPAEEDSEDKEDDSEEKDEAVEEDDEEMVKHRQDLSVCVCVLFCCFIIFKKYFTDKNRQR